MGEGVLVLCSLCGALRSLELAPECFCGERAYRPAPAPQKSPEEALWKREEDGVRVWKPGEHVRWYRRDRWWYGDVVRQDGDRVLVRETAKGEDRAGGKEGWTAASRLREDSNG